MAIKKLFFKSSNETEQVLMGSLRGWETVLYVLIFLKLNSLYFYDAKKDLKGTKLLYSSRKT